MFIDTFYISFFNRFKKGFKKKAVLLAQVYITFLELSLVLLLVSFFAAFANQMKIDLMSQTKAIVLLIILAIGIWFKNWLKFTGKKRNVLNASKKRKDEPLWKLILVPIVCLILTFVFVKSIY
ncbi:hypothetical protein [Winogradskyella sp. A3E31]|uniref:hypothetical protein n=1 Tax=Winogradskyella sp. A3E31 TaxID=3349637 RepID=UPI00398A85EB